MKRCWSCFDQHTDETQRVCDVNVVLQTKPSVERGSYNRTCRSAEDVISVFESGDQDAERYAFWPTISFLMPHN